MTNRYTVYARWANEVVEEIDVDASSENEAITLATKELKDHYIPGYTIIRCEQRIGLYF